MKETFTDNQELCENNPEDLQDLNKKFEKEKKKKIIKIILIVLACILLVAAIIIFLLFKIFKKKEEEWNIVIQPKSGITNFVFIFMHGFNEYPRKHYDVITQKLNFPDKDNTKIILPHAPIMSVTVKKDKKYNSWFDLKYFPSNSTDSYSFEELQKSSLEIIQPMIHEEAKKLNGNYSKIFLGGYSQGAYMTFYTAYSMNETLGGAIELSGILSPQFEINNQNDKTNMPSFIAFSDTDEIVDYNFFNETIGRIRNYSGVDIHVYHGYPHVPPFFDEELKDLNEFLQKNMN